MTIRKILLLQLICLSSIFYCYAGTGTFTIGADAGPGLSALYGPTSYFNDIFISRQVYLSPSAGINFGYNFPKIVSIGSGIYYYQFSYSYRENVSFPPPIIPYYTNIERWKTINIPLLARVSFGKKIVFFVEAGPFLSIFLAGSDANAAYNWMVYPWYPPRTINVGITADAGIEAPLPHRFALSFKVSSNVNIENINSGSNYTKTYSCTLLCGFSYTLPVTGSKLKTPDGGYNTIFRN